MLQKYQCHVLGIYRWILCALVKLHKIFFFLGLFRLFCYHTSCTEKSNLRTLRECRRKNLQIEMFLSQASAYNMMENLCRTSGMKIWECKWSFSVFCVISFHFFCPSKCGLSQESAMINFSIVNIHNASFLVKFFFVSIQNYELCVQKILSLLALERGINFFVDERVRNDDGNHDVDISF